MMTPEQASAIAFCMGPSLSAWYCRQHFPTAPIIDDEWCPHAGLDCVCSLRTKHKNRCRCWRCGREYPKGETTR